jgi:hypothetical protein
VASPVRLYQQEMHNNVGFFAAWLPASTIDLGDIGILEAGRFRRMGSLKELGVSHLAVREGTPQNLSYSASADRRAGASAEVTGALPVAPVVKGELSIRFTEQGGFVFEAMGIRNVEISDRIALADHILAIQAVYLFQPTPLRIVLKGLAGSINSYEAARWKAKKRKRDV